MLSCWSVIPCFLAARVCMSRQTAQPLIWLARVSTRSTVDGGIPALAAASLMTFANESRASSAPGTVWAGFGFSVPLVILHFSSLIEILG